MSTTTFDELEPRERRRVWWGFIWRGFVITACSGLAGAVFGFVVGFLIGFVATSLGHDVEGPGVQLLIKILALTGGVVVGLVVSWLYVRWLFRARLGGFRLLLAPD